jgi:DNA-binding PadR family transcriptional regulator
VEVRLNGRTALLQTLLEGPGYGLELIGRVRTRSAGRIRLRQGVVYPALAELERDRLVRGWSVPLASGGRPRRYYELTPAGFLAAQSEREALSGLLRQAPRAAATAPELARMRERILECSELSEFAMSLREQALAAGAP